VKAAAGDLKTVKLLQKGDILLEVSSAVQSRCVIQLKKLAGCPVQVTTHRLLNTSKDVICCKDLSNCSKEEILDELGEQAVIDVNITVRNDSGRRRNTNTYILTFRLSTVPRLIRIGYIRVPISEYIPNPLWCFTCQKFGHGSSTCKGATTRAIGGQVGHVSNDSTSRPKCVNCKEVPEVGAWKVSTKDQSRKGHFFYWGPYDCRIWKHSCTYSNWTVQSSLRGQPITVVARARKDHAQITTPSIHTQTTLMWSESQDAPSQVTSASTSAQTDLPIPQARLQPGIGLSSVLHPLQHSIGYMGDGFYRSKNPTNSIKVLKK